MPCLAYSKYGESIYHAGSYRHSVNRKSIG